MISRSRAAAPRSEHQVRHHETTAGPPAIVLRLLARPVSFSPSKRMMQGIVGDTRSSSLREFKVLDRRHHASHGVEALLSGLASHPAVIIDSLTSTREDVGAFPRQGQCQSPPPAPEVDTVRAGAHLRRLDRHGCPLGHPHVVVPVPGIRPGLPFAPLRMDGQARPSFSVRGRSDATATSGGDPAPPPRFGSSALGDVPRKALRQPWLAGNDCGDCT